MPKVKGIFKSHGGDRYTTLRIDYIDFKIPQVGRDIRSADQKFIIIKRKDEFGTELNVTLKVGQEVTENFVEVLKTYYDYTEGGIWDQVKNNNKHTYNGD